MTLQEIATETLAKQSEITKKMEADGMTPFDLLPFTTLLALEYAVAPGSTNESHIETRASIEQALVLKARILDAALGIETHVNMVMATKRVAL